MMLIATTVVASVLFASITSAAAAPAASSPAIPPMIVTVTLAANVSPSLLRSILAEADAIWRPSGVTFVWQSAAPLAKAAHLRETGPYVPDTLYVVIGENQGVGHDGRRPLGWIVFDDVATPDQQIYLSHANALAMMEDARGVVGIVGQMPQMQRETLLARAMGRALAHELGHYLLASKTHTQRGLMKPVMTAVELFNPDASGFRIEPAQRRAVAARLRGEPMVASR
jgi:hypothetical protein